MLLLEENLLEAREELRFKATHDSLTTLWNRAVILDILQREITRSTRDQSKGVTIVLSDIDHFKKVNDTYGYAVGDTVLRGVAARLNAAVRSYDAVSRYGGEDSHRIGWVSQHIRRLIDSCVLIPAAVLLTVSMSLGVAGTDDWSGFPQSS